MELDTNRETFLQSSKYKNCYLGAIIVSALLQDSMPFFILLTSRYYVNINLEVYISVVWKVVTLDVVWSVL